MKKTLTALLTIVSLGTATYNSSASLTGTFTFDGTTTPTTQTGPWNMTSTDSTYAILRFVLDTPTKFSDIGSLSYGYDVNLGGIGGGAPRAVFVFDNNSFLAVHWGPAGSFADPTIGDNLNTGNLLALTDNGRYDLSGSAGSAYTDRAAALALAGNWNVVRISLIVDSFGGNDRDIDINSIDVGDSAIVTPVPEPSTYIAGALLLLPFGTHVIRRLRNRQPVA